MRLVSSSDEVVRLVYSDSDSLCIQEITESLNGLFLCLPVLLISSAIGLLETRIIGFYSAAIGILPIIGVGIWRTFHTKRNWRILLHKDRLYLRLIRDLRVASLQLVEPLIQDVLEIEHCEIKALSSLLVVVQWTSFPWKRISQNSRDYIVVKPSINDENTESVLRQISANMTLGCDSGLISLAGAKNAEIYLYTWKVRPRVGQFLQSVATRFPTIPIGPYEKRVIDMRKYANLPEPDLKNQMDLLNQLNFGVALQHFLKRRRELMHPGKN